jgi:hypothetical protein
MVRPREIVAKAGHPVTPGESGDYRIARFRAFEEIGVMPALVAGIHVFLVAPVIENDGNF